MLTRAPFLKTARGARGGYRVEVVRSSCPCYKGIFREPREVDLLMTHGIGAVNALETSGSGHFRKV